MSMLHSLCEKDGKGPKDTRNPTSRADVNRSNAGHSEAQGRNPHPQRWVLCGGGGAISAGRRGALASSRPARAHAYAPTHLPANMTFKLQVVSHQWVRKAI